MDLQYDKLYVDNAVYIYSEESGEIEMINQQEVEAEQRVREWGYFRAHFFQHIDII